MQSENGPILILKSEILSSQDSHQIARAQMQDVNHGDSKGTTLLDINFIIPKLIELCLYGSKQPNLTLGISV